MANTAQWRDAALACSYPFAENAPLTDVTGTYSLPIGLFADARLNVPAGTGEVRLGSLAQQGDGVTGTVLADGRALGTFSVAATGADPLTAPVVDALGVTRGLLVFGPAPAPPLPAAALAFAAGAAVFAAPTLFYAPAPTLSSLAVTDPAGYAATLTGRIAFAPGAGVAVVNDPAGTIRLDAVGAADETVAVCFDPLGDPIRSIDSLPLSPTGDFRFEPDQYEEPASADTPRQVLRVDLGANTLTFGLARPA